MIKPTSSHRMVVGMRSWASLLAIVLLVACGNNDTHAPSAPSAVTAPVEFIGVYKHPSESGDTAARLTISPAGIAVSGTPFWTSAITWSSGSGEPSTGWNFECAEESRGFCARGSLVKTSQGVIASVTGGTRTQEYMTAYGGAWVPVAASTPTAPSPTMSTESPEWMRGNWECVLKAHSRNCTYQRTATVRASSVTEVEKSRRTPGWDCGAVGTNEETWQLPAGTITGSSSYRVCNTIYTLDGEDILISEDGSASDECNAYTLPVAMRAYNCSRLRRRR